jgi:4-hydroxybenzoate polyprenyltransferase
MNIKNILHLFRIKNLVIIAITMILMQYFIVSHLLGYGFLEGGMQLLEFSLLVIATLLISIGGYIINDIFDVNADSINKPGKNLVGNLISEKAATSLYWITTVLGILLGTLTSYLINQINFAIIFFLSAGLLWFYSQKYSCQPLVGNIVVSVLSALSFGIVWLFEFYSLSSNAFIFAEVQPAFKIVNRIVFIYVTFAFSFTWLRETIKDIEDYKGDNRFGCRTLPVVYGISVSKIFGLILSIIILLLLVYIQWYFFRTGYLFQFYWFFIVDVLLLVILYKLYRANEKNDFTRLSSLIKITMFTGVLSMILFIMN